MRQDLSGPDELRSVIANWARRQPEPGDALCPDAEILAAFSDGSLTEAMHATITSHLGTCPSCQLALAAMARMESSALEEKAAAAASVSARRRWWRWLAPAVAAASAVLVWIVVDQPAVQENLRDARLSTTASDPEPLTVSPTPAAPRTEGAPLTSATPPAPAVPPATAAPVVERQASPTVEARAERPGGVAGNATTPDARAPQDLQVASPATPAPPESAAPTAPEPAAEREAAERSRDASAVAPGPRPQQAFVTEADRTAGRAGPVRTASDRPASAAEAAADQRAKAVGKLAAAIPPQRPRAVKDFEVSAPDGQRRWRVTANGVSVTHDGGKTWGDEPALRGRIFREGSATSDGACWLVGEAGLVMRFTSDRGWHAVTRPAETDIVSVGAFTATNAVVETEGGLRYVTSDGGQSWRVNP